MESRHIRRHDAISKMPTEAADIVTEGAQMETHHSEQQPVPHGD